MQTALVGRKALHRGGIMDSTTTPLTYAVVRPQDGAAFWTLLGPAFTSHQIQKDLGGPVYVDERSVCVVALDGDRLVGWGMLVREKARVVLDWAYVVPERRSQGVYGALLARMLTEAGDGEVRGSTRSPHVASLYVRHGFVLTGKPRGAWRTFVRAGRP